MNDFIFLFIEISILILNSLKYSNEYKVDYKFVQNHFFCNYPTLLATKDQKLLAAFPTLVAALLASSLSSPLVIL